MNTPKERFAGLGSAKACSMAKLISGLCTLRRIKLNFQGSRALLDLEELNLIFNWTPGFYEKACVVRASHTPVRGKVSRSHVELEGLLKY